MKEKKQKSNCNFWSVLGISAISIFEPIAGTLDNNDSAKCIDQKILHLHPKIFPSNSVAEIAVQTASGSANSEISATGYIPT